MQLRRLRIVKFRNLKDVELRFATHLPVSAGAAGKVVPKPIRSHTLIGQNGTGKSNLIEALITIFRDVDLDRDVTLDYTLEYEIRGFSVRLEADREKQKRPFVWVDGKAESQGHLLKNRELLPAHIFAYYSGRNERIEALFQEHQRRFNHRQEITADEVLPKQLLENFTATDSDIRALEETKRRREARLKQAGDDRLRRLFYCRGGHSQLVLLACLLSDDPVFQKVLKNLHIESLESALFVLKEPHRLREKRRNGKFDENELNEGDPRFWYARGNVDIPTASSIGASSDAFHGEGLGEEPSRLSDFLGDVTVGFGDGVYAAMTFGFADLNYVRDGYFDTGFMDTANPAYSFGEATGNIEGGIGLGGALGLVKLARRSQFSHWIPDRFVRLFTPKGKPNRYYVPWIDRYLGGFVRSNANGTVVPKFFHQLTDAKAWQFVPRSIKNVFYNRVSPIPQGLQQLLRTPWWVVGGVAGSTED